MNHPEVDDLIRRALAEDLSSAGDITTRATVPAKAEAQARVVARATGTIAGLHITERVFHMLDPNLTYTPHVTEGAAVDANTLLAEIQGPAAPILTGERTALNFLGHLSGIATATSELVEQVDGTGAGIVDTRKTTPGLRAIEKYAVRMGGGANHRFGLYDAVLIKDNHIALADGIRPAIKRVRGRVGHLVKIQVEVDRLDQVDELLDAGADAVLLDNMDTATLQKAVRRIHSRMTTEASGNITAVNVRDIAETGVDYISVGWITHSAPRLDVALDISGGSVSKRTNRQH